MCKFTGKIAKKKSIKLINFMLFVFSLIVFRNPRVGPRIGNDVSWVLLSHLVTLVLLHLAIRGLLRGLVGDDNCFF